MSTTIEKAVHQTNGDLLSPQIVESLIHDRHEPRWLQDFRRKSLEIAVELPLPDRRDEVWRRTDIRGFNWKNYSYQFSVPEAVKDPKSFPDSLWKFAELENCPVDGFLITLDGRYYFQWLKPGLERNGVLFMPLHQAVEQHSDLIHEYFMKEGVLPEENIFTAVHGALWTGGFFLYVPPKVELSLPLHIVNASSKPDLADLSHILVIAGEQSRVTLLHNETSINETAGGFHDGAVEIFVQRGAKVNYIKVQNWDDRRWNFSSEKARLYGDSQLTWVSVALGSKLSKVHQILDMVKPGSNGEMLGIEFLHSNQHIDYYTQQNHLAPHTTSNLLYHGVLSGNSRSVWRGNIRVFPSAQRTDGYQANHNLLLNPEARADSIPGLEIEADDVRCTHGSTTGNIEDEYLFYLMSRGLPKKKAEELIIAGFFEPVLQKVTNSAIQEILRGAIEKEIERRV